MNQKIQIISPEVEDQSSTIKSAVESPHLVKYLNIMGMQSLLSIQQEGRMNCNKLAKVRMLADADRSSSELIFRVVSHTPNSQCLVLVVAYSRFSFFISVLLSQNFSDSHQIPTQFSGNFATVYRAKIFDQSVAIKCTHFNKSNLLKTLKDVLAEYVVLKVAAKLGVGPQMKDSLGFDLIVYQDCIEFCMEYCSPIDNRPNISQQLTKGLLTLHSLQIIHLDIKPDNVCYSEANGHAVLIEKQC